MATNIRQSNRRLQLVLASIVSGALVFKDRILGVAIADTDFDGNVAIDQGCEAILTKDTSTAFTLGGPVWWDLTNSKCVAPGTANSVHIGEATAAAGSSAATLQVQLHDRLGAISGVAQVDNGATTETVVHTAFADRAGGHVMVSFLGSPGTAAKVYASWSSNDLVITVNADPGANIQVAWVVL